MSDADLNREIIGIITEFSEQNAGPVPEYAVVNFFEEVDRVSLSRERVAEQIELLVRRGDIERTENGVINA